MQKVLGDQMKQKDRKDFTCAVKIDTLIEQGFCCNIKKCHKGFTKDVRPHFDHIHGRTDKSPENCQALCPNCHNTKSVNENKEDAERQRKERENTNN